MITNIQIINFGPFRSLNLNIKPITVLCGMNGLGKSLIWNTILNIRNVIKNSDHKLLMNMFEDNLHIKTTHIIFDIKIQKSTFEFRILNTIIPMIFDDDYTIRYAISLHKEYNLYDSIVQKVEMRILERDGYEIEISRPLSYAISNILERYAKAGIMYNKRAEVCTSILKDECLSNSFSRTLIFEHPEAHYHPEVQLLTTDHLITLLLHNTHSIVETHSSLIINRLVRRIVEDDGDLVKNVAIYNFAEKNEITECEEIKLNHHQGICNWPNGFIDQGADESKSIILAGIEKHRKSKKKG